MISFQFYQPSPTTVWTIEHNLNCKPVFDIWVDDGGVRKKIYPEEVTHVNDDLLQLVFFEPRSGSARLIGQIE
jgi:hypothetical protein